MEEKLVKEAWKEAENSSREKQKEEVKKIIEKTLSKLKSVEKSIYDSNEKIKDLRKQKKVLEMDLEDIKNGRLDLMSERQEKDEESKNVSVVVIIKEKETIIERERISNPWYWPYNVVWQVPEVRFDRNFYTQADIRPNLVFGDATQNTGGYQVNNTCFSLTCSSAKDFASGTYDIDGDIVNIR